MVDTGATNVALSEGRRQHRAGLSPRGRLAPHRQRPVAAHRVRLREVRVGDVTVYNVDATIVPAMMDMVLLGNSFLSRFQMKRDADVLVLEAVLMAQPSIAGLRADWAPRGLVPDPA